MTTDPRPADILIARALRGSAITAGAYAFAQALRLGSNLVVARLLFPEAFGLMALVTVVLVGLTMFSDMGLGPAILRSPRGDDRPFLDTAWTLSVARGLVLFLLACLLALPLAALYDAPALAALILVAALSLLIHGFSPTRIDTANRHLLLGRVTLLDLASQTLGILVMIALAFASGSVWSLVLGAVAGALTRLALMWTLLPGPANRFAWDPEAGRELLHFGKWIFASTVCGFLISQGDRLILGAYLTLGQLGLYNIGYFLASFPWLLGAAVAMRVMIPLYRDDPPGTKAANAPRLRRLRMAMTAGLLFLLALLAFAGTWLVELLYDDRYRAAGGIVVAVACLQMPLVIGMTYDQAALAAGASRQFFAVILVRALVQTGAFLAGAHFGGLTAALAAQGLAVVCLHPLLVWLARRHGVWDGRHDALWFAVASVLAGLALWLNADAIAALG